MDHFFPTSSEQPNISDRRLALLRCGVGCIVLLPSADRSRCGPLKMPPRVREGECHPRWQLSGWVTEVP